MRPFDDGPASVAITQLFQRRAHGIKPRLDIIRRLLQELGHPERDLRCIHVAGTNGKGSVCALLASVFRASGYKTGLYTSPHLIRFHERFQINGEPIGSDVLSSLIEEVGSVADRIAAEPEGRPATFFECATAMAFLHFARQKLDVAIIETGMGGRWDATNVVNPLLSIITRIDYDHTEYLGPDLPTIASEKAGIIKPSRPVLIGDPPPEVLAVFERVAREQGAPLVRSGDLAQVTRAGQTLDGQRIKVELASRSLPVMRLPLLGRHQLENAALAFAAVEILEQGGLLSCEVEAIRAGTESCVWPGRLQLLRRDPDVLLDVAHNPGGALALVQSLKELAGKRPWGLIAGILRDKDATGFLRAFAGRLDACWTVPIEDERGRTAEETSAAAKEAGLSATASDWATAWKSGLEWARTSGGVLVVAGSLYLAGDVLYRMEKGMLPS